MRMVVRSYEAGDAAALVAIHNALYPEEGRTLASFWRHMKALETAGGTAWVVEEGGDVAGYVAVAPLPGLEGIMGLEGFIAPKYQRRGLGSRLLAHLVEELKPTGARQLSHGVTELDSPAARFLSRYGFYVEHEEWVMVLSDLAQLPPPALPAMCRAEVLGRAQAIGQFGRLYDASFSGQRWYQPYTATEVAATLGDAADILFLVCGGKPVGFVWIRLAEAEAGEIEPLGVIAAEQGKGYGRLLLAAGLHELAQRGARQVAIGLWRENEAALHLYRSFDFRHSYSRIYLAYDL